MALSAGTNITGLDHILQQLIIQLALYKQGNPTESTQNREFNCLHLLLVQNKKRLIIGTKQHKNTV